MKVKNHTVEFLKKIRYTKILKTVHSMAQQKFSHEDWRFRVATVMYTCEIAINISKKDMVVLR